MPTPTSLAAISDRRRNAAVRRPPRPPRPPTKPTVRPDADRQEGSWGRKQLGAYHLIERLAIGGMAEIYLARLEGVVDFDKRVVVKRIRSRYANDERFISMFLDEARLAACLYHQNIAHVYQNGRDDDAYFFAMEYLDGKDTRALLGELCRHGRTLPLEHALTIVAGVAAGLRYAHDRVAADGRRLGIVHRDISPSNVFVTYEGAVKIVDFGIARAAERTSDTDHGTRKGKVCYMSPEQHLGVEVDRRSDIFSLGILMYELTTSAPLFCLETENRYAIASRIIRGDIPPPSTRVPGYPPGLEQIVMKALRPNRHQRHRDAGELLSALEAFATEHRLPLSAMALSNYMKRMFDRPPEPWHELAEQLETTAELATEDLEELHDSTELTVRTEPGIGPPSKASGPRRRTVARAHAVAAHAKAARREPDAFRETMWFKKGELDAMAAEAALAAQLRGDDPLASDRVDELPLEDRYRDDGTISAQDEQCYSLRAGRPQTLRFPLLPSAPVDPSRVAELVRAGHQRRDRFLGLMVIASLALLALAGYAIW